MPKQHKVPKEVQIINPDELRIVKAFAAVSKAARDKLAQIATAQECRPGKYFVKGGTPGNEVLFLIEGTAKVSRIDRAGKEVVLKLFGPGDMIGEIAVLVESNRTADVVALSKCRLAVFPGLAFFEMLRTEPLLSFELLKAVAGRLKVATERITDLALHDVNTRVSRALVGLSIPANVDGQDVLVIPERPTHQILANMVGASRETVTRALHELEGLGHIALDGERVIVYSMPE